MRGISWLAEILLASQEGLCCMEWVSEWLSKEGWGESIVIRTKQPFKKGLAKFAGCSDSSSSDSGSSISSTSCISSSSSSSSSSGSSGSSDMFYPPNTAQNATDTTLHKHYTTLYADVITLKFIINIQSVKKL